MNTLTFKALLFGIFLLFGNTACAQKTKKNPFQQVEVPDAVLNQLNQVANQKEKHIADKNPMYITNLLSPQDIEYKDGIYYFRVMSPHALGRIFITNKNKVTIFKSTGIGLVQEYSDYLLKNSLSDKLGIAYLKAIATHLEKQYNSEHQ